MEAIEKWTLMEVSSVPFPFQYHASHGHRSEQTLPLLPPITDESINGFLFHGLFLPQTLLSHEAASSRSPICLSASLTLSAAQRRTPPSLSPPSAALMRRATGR